MLEIHPFFHFVSIFNEFGKNQNFAPNTYVYLMEWREKKKTLVFLSTGEDWTRVYRIRSQSVGSAATEQPLGRPVLLVFPSSVSSRRLDPQSLTTCPPPPPPPRLTDREVKKAKWPKLKKGTGLRQEMRDPPELKYEVSPRLRRPRVQTRRCGLI